MKPKMHYLVLFIAAWLYVNPCIAQNSADSILAYKAYRNLTKAGWLNGISLAFGIAGNIEMAAIGGFPLEYDHGHNAEVNLSHAFLCTVRLSLELIPPINVSRARHLLKPWRESPEMAPTCEKLFAAIDAAQVLTAIAPVLTVAGGIMMIAGSQSRYENAYWDSPDHVYKLKNPELKTVGWICVGAGLLTSLSASILIGSAKKELWRKMGVLRMTA